MAPPLDGVESDLAMSKASTAQLEEASAAMARRRELRQANLAPTRPGEEELKALDSSMKRNTALLRKLRALSDETGPALVSEVGRVNQSKYVAEAAAALAEAPLRPRDVSAALDVLSALHRRYADAAPEAAAAIARGFADASAPLARRRALLRMLAEMALCALLPGPAPLLAAARSLAAAADFAPARGGGAARDPEAPLAALSLLTTLAKAGREELLGLPPAPLPGPAGAAAAAAEAEAEAAAEAREEGAAAPEAPPEVAAAREAYRGALERNEFERSVRYALPAEAQRELAAAAARALAGAAAALEAAHEALSALERDNARVLNNRGDLPEGAASAYEARRREFEALQRGAAALAEALDRPLPELGGAATRVADAAGAAPAAEASDAPEQVFEDEESRAFYQSLPDIRALVPAVLLGEKTGAAAAGKGGAEEGGKGGGRQAGEEAADGGDEEAAASSAAAATADGGDAPADAPPGAALEAVLRALPSTTSKELADELALAFCHCQTRGARRRLARALCEPPPGALALLPFYARVAAALGQVFPDIPAAVASSLEAEFGALASQPDAAGTTAEARQRCARYVGELLKFRAYPPGAAFSGLKRLLDDFSGLNIDMTCALVESAGRFLYRQPETSTRMSNMLDVMMRLKGARHLGGRQAALVDGAYYAVHSAGRPPPRKKRPPTHEYVRSLVYDQLAEGEVTKVLKKLRRLPWAEHEAYVLRTLLRASHKGRYSQIPYIASLVAGLSRYRPSLGVALVDSLLEELAAGLEAPDAGGYQRLVAAAVLLGEAYNYRLVTAPVVFAALRSFLSTGHEPGTPPEATARLDPPSSYFRLRLVCALLGACGSYFARGAARKRLEGWLPYLEAYRASKPPPPLDVEFDLQELYEKLKVSPARYATPAEAAAAVRALETAAAAAAAAGLAPVEEEEEEEEQDEDEEAEGEEGGSDAEDGASEGGGSTSASQGGDEDDEEAGSSDDELEGDTMVRLRGARPVAAVDEDFEREWAALMAEHQGPGPAGAAAAAAAGPPPPAAALGGERGATLAFKVVMRRAGKEDRSRELRLPLSSGVAAAAAAQRAAEAREKEDLKRLVLAAGEREEREAGDAALAAGDARRGRRYGAGARR